MMQSLEDKESKRKADTHKNMQKYRLSINTDPVKHNSVKEKERQRAKKNYAKGKLTLSLTGRKKSEGKIEERIAGEEEEATRNNLEGSNTAIGSSKEEKST